MDAILILLLVGVTAAAGWLLAFGDPGRVGVAGTLLGGVLGFLTGLLSERSRRRMEERRRFEQERRDLYVRFLAAAAKLELEIAGHFGMARDIARNLSQDPPQQPYADDSALSQLVDEIEIMAPVWVYDDARTVWHEINLLDAFVRFQFEENHPWNREKQYALWDSRWIDKRREVRSLRQKFILSAKRDLATPTGIAGPWAKRISRLRDRIRA